MVNEKDIVLVYFEDKPLMFARIEDISPDMKKDWYHVKMLALQIPLQVMTWILRDVYINGEEFTMDGKKMRFERVDCPEDPDDPVSKDDDSPKDRGSPKVIALTDRKKID